jgi:two-component system cell cycle response regulator DivK
MVKLLLVEDDEDNLDMLRRRLGRAAFEIVVARDGQEACAQAAAERPDLILMDLHMPVLDGWDATRRLKGLPETRAIPIIALTADAMAGDREKALEAGCDDYDTKPVHLPRLLEKIKQLLRKKEAERAERPPG